MIFNSDNRFEDKEHEALMGLWWSGVLLKRESKKFFKGRAFSESQFNVLMSLKYADRDLSQQDLSRRLLVDKSNLTDLIDTLEELDFVRRRKEPQDRRFHRLELTEKGRMFLQGIEPAYWELVHRIMSVFREDEICRITEYMVRLQEGLEKDE